jgi:hypothetical protein
MTKKRIRAQLDATAPLRVHDPSQAVMSDREEEE